MGLPNGGEGEKRRPAATPHPGSTELTEVRPLSRKGRGEQEQIASLYDNCNVPRVTPS